MLETKKNLLTQGFRLVITSLLPETQGFKNGMLDSQKENLKNLLTQEFKLVITSLQPETAKSC